MIAGLVLVNLGIVLLAAIGGEADAMAAAVLFSAVLWLLGGGIYYCVTA